MEKNIENYLPFYLGCYAFLPDGTRVYIEGIYKSDGNLYVKYLIQDSRSDLNGVDGSYLADSIKLILRPLSDMTEEEALFIADKISDWAWRKEFKIQSIDKAGGSVFITVYYLLEGAPHGIGDGEYTKQLIISDDTIWGRDFVNRSEHEIVLNTHAITAYLLSKHFDLFGLIDAGLAHRYRTLKPNTSLIKNQNKKHGSIYVRVRRGQNNKKKGV